VAHAAPAISCVIPAYNAAAYLGEAIESVLGQTLPPRRVVVVDDGSTDGTADVAARYGPRVLVLRQANEGRASACNVGLEAARGDFVAFLDADDLWHPQKLERQVERFRQGPELGYCLTLIQNFVSPELAGRADGLDPALFQPRPGFVLPTLLARRGLFDQVGGFRPELRHAHDTDWFLRARASGATVAMLPEVLVRRRLHLQNLSQRDALASHREYLGLVKSTLDGRRAR
jgi:glycosyltransferase involved in cell wall biosynthesis